jgi:hypothetical protein
MNTLIYLLKLREHFIGWRKNLRLLTGYSNQVAACVSWNF